MADTNAKVAREMFNDMSYMRRSMPGTVEQLIKRIETALATAQSNLAREVLAEIQTTARPTAMAVDVLRDLLTRMGISMEGE